MQLASTTYAGANHTHLTELLRDREGIDLSRPTVRRILARVGIPSPVTTGNLIIAYIPDNPLDYSSSAYSAYRDILRANRPITPLLYVVASTV